MIQLRPVLILQRLCFPIRTNIFQENSSCHCSRNNIRLLTRQVVLGFIVLIPHSPMMFNIIVLFDRLVNFIKRLKNKNIHSPGDHRTYTVLPVTCGIRHTRDGIFVVFATGRPVSLAYPEIERFVSLDRLDMIKCFCLILAR